MNIFLDDLRQTPLGFERTFTVEETIKLIAQNPKKVGILSLDNDLGIGFEDGYKVLDWLEEQVFSGHEEYLPNEIVVHSANPIGGKRMRVVIEKLYK